MDLKLIKMELEPKRLLQVYMYDHVVNELSAIAEKEGIKVTQILRHCVNNFISEYRKEERPWKTRQ
jgi:hypothetical protein